MSGAPNTHNHVSPAARFESAGYYFSYDVKSRTWDMEKRLYDQSRFKAVMLVVLVVSFAGLSVLSFMLML
jgi:hypothetical protein